MIRPDARAFWLISCVDFDYVEDEDWPEDGEAPPNGKASANRKAPAKDGGRQTGENMKEEQSSTEDSSRGH